MENFSGIKVGDKVLIKERYLGNEYFKLEEVKKVTPKYFWVDGYSSVRFSISEGVCAETHPYSVTHFNEQIWEIAKKAMEERAHKRDLASWLDGVWWLGLSTEKLEQITAIVKAK